MPLVRSPNGPLVLKCINDGDGNHGIVGPYLNPDATTMTALPGYRALVIALPPTQVAAQVRGGLVNIPARIDATSGTPVRAYMCEVCGYIESYAAHIAAPNEWPFNG